MSRSKKVILTASGVLLLLAVIVAALLPVLIRSKAVEVLGEATGREVLIEKVSLNPFTLKASVRGLAIVEKGGAPFFSIGELRVAVSPLSLYRRALVLSEVALDSVSLKIVRTSADRFNFTDIAELQKKKGESPKKTGIFPFVSKNVRLAKGYCELDDQAVAGGRKHVIRDLEITLPWLSSLPDDKDSDVSLRIAMKVNEAPLTLSARSKPFRADLESSVHIVLQKLSLPELAVYIPQPPPVELASGSFTVDADIGFRFSAGGRPDFNLKGLARLEELALNQRQGQPLVRLPVLEVNALNVEPLAGIFAFNSITLEEPELFVRRDRQGQWMYERLLAAGDGKTAKREAPDVARPPVPDKTAPPQFSVAAVALKKGRIHFQDDLPPGGFKAEIVEFNLASQGIGNSPGKTGQYDLSLQVVKDARFSSTGSFTVNGPSARTRIELAGLALKGYWPYLSGYLAAPLGGVANLEGEVAFSPEAGLSVNSGNLSIRNFSARYGAGEGVDLASLTITGAAFHQKTNRLQIDRVNLSGGDISLSREENGDFSPQSLMITNQKGLPEAPAVAAVAAGTKQPEVAKPLFYHLKRLEVDKFQIAFTDKNRPGKPRFTLRDARLSLADLKGPEQGFAKLSFASIFGRDATLQAAGELVFTPLKYRGKVGIGRLPIRDFEAYYPETFNFQVLGGLLDANLALDIALADGALRGSFNGEAGIGVLHLIDSVEEEDLLKWRRLQLDGIEGDLEPFRLVVGQVSLNEVFSRIIVRKDGTLNLQDMIKSEKTDSPEAAAQTVAKPQTVAEVEKQAPEGQAASANAMAPDIRVGAVTIADGTVKFTDKHLPSDFETTFYNLGGRISGLSSEVSALADVDLRGNLENHSPLRIAGKINPLRGDIFVDLKLSFADIELSPMSPYSETYLGYILKQGKLFLDLTYHIEKKKLVSENKIKIDQFTFGDSVESDKATSLPVKLGLALLKDRHGEINLDVPVVGSIDDPRFNIWRIVFQVIKNLLVKAVTAPFSLLSSLFSGAGDISAVVFSPGSTIINPAEQKKLEALAKGLNERPALKISVMAYVDSQSDTEGYRNELFERKLKREKFVALMKERSSEAGESAETMTITPLERPVYLKALYAKEKFPKPRDAKGAEISLPEQEMAKLILANIRVDKDELEDLAGERAAAVKDFLIGKGNIPAERIFEKKDDIFKVRDKGDLPGSRVELNVVVP
jgi:uncharacterized protein involved in outer membrane biogenesis